MMGRACYKNANCAKLVFATERLAEDVKRVRAR